MTEIPASAAGRAALRHVVWPHAAGRALPKRQSPAAERLCEPHAGHRAQPLSQEGLTA